MGKTAQIRYMQYVKNLQNYLFYVQQYQSMRCEKRWKIINYFSILSGVRQGEILSPLLFNIFVNDLEHYMLSQGCKVVDFNDDMYNNYLKILLLLYADDTVIFSNSERGLQKCLDILHAYCMKWKLNVNSDKTKVIIFRKPRSGCNYTFKYAQGEIKTVDSQISRHYIQL